MFVISELECSGKGGLPELSIEEKWNYGGWVFLILFLILLILAITSVLVGNRFPAHRTPALFIN